MGKKLGLEVVTEEDGKLIEHLLGVMQSLQLDYTLFFRTLSRYDGDRRALMSLGLYHKPLHGWLDDYDARLKKNEAGTARRHEAMLQANPKYVLKNYMLDEAIAAAEEGEYGLIEDLFAIARDPFAEHPQFEHWAGVTPERYKNKKLSCSS